MISVPFFSYLKKKNPTSVILRVLMVSFLRRPNIFTYNFSHYMSYLVDSATQAQRSNSKINLKKQSLRF